MHASVAALVHRAALAHPHKAALTYHAEKKPLPSSLPLLAKTSWTYAEVWAAALHAALKVRKAASASSSSTASTASTASASLNIVVFVDEGPALPLIELAILLAGCVIVPIDLHQPQARLLSMLSTCTPSLLIHACSSASLASPLAESDTRLLASLIHKASLPKACALSVHDIFHDLDLAAQSSDFSQPPKHLSAIWAGTQPDDLSHIIFTSGSTGHPKACMGTHGGLANYCAAKNKAHGVTSDSVCFVASSHTFDPSLGDFFACWSLGACIATAPRERIFSALAQVLQESRASHILTSPAMFRTVGAWAPEAFPALQVVALGGEPMPEELATQWAPHVRLVNTYGVTECVVYQAAYQVHVAHGIKHGHRLLGDALDGNALLILDPQQPLLGENEAIVALQPEGDGREGEIVIAGAQVGLGYYNSAPETTHAAFITLSGHGRCFRTGDRVASFERGRWVFLGRRDDQVKVNGQRMELGEIEAAVLRAAAPLATRVVVVKPKPGVLPVSAGLVAFLTLAKESVSEKVVSGGEEVQKGEIEGEAGGDEGGDEGGGGSWADGQVDTSSAAPANGDADADPRVLADPEHLVEDALRMLASTELPRIMVPARLVCVSHFPLNASGKVDRHALVALFAQHLTEAMAQGAEAQDGGEEGTAAGSAPLSALEVVIAQAWTQQLGLPAGMVGRRSHFSELGGDSLGALRVCRAILDLLGLKQEPKEEKRRVEDASSSSKGSSKGREDPEDDGGAAGEFLEKEALIRPQDLLTRPRFSDFVAFVTEAVEARSVGGAVSASSASSSITASEATSVFFRAAGAGHAGLVRLMLDREIVHPDGTTRDAASSLLPHSNSLTPLHAACAAGHTAVVQALLVAGASATASDAHGVQPLHLASQRGPLALVKLLLGQKGVQVSAKDGNDQTVLHHAGRGGAGRKVLDALLEAWLAEKAVSRAKSVAPLEWKDVWGRTPLHWAAINGHPTSVAALVAAGASERAVDGSGETPLSMAMRRAKCSAKERPDGMGAGVFGAITKMLGGSGTTKNLTKEGL